MKAQVLQSTVDLHVNPEPLVFCDIRTPQPGPEDILIHIRACGVCHTELDEIEGRTPPAFFPVIPGHQVVGTVCSCGCDVTRHSVEDRVGVAWIFRSCGQCSLCRKGFENLCSEFQATGRDANGGYAEFMVVHQDYAFPIPSVLSDYETAPLLCAGAVGYRSLQLTGLTNGEPLGLTGFGGSGHLVLQLAGFLFPDSDIFVFTRNRVQQEFALELGAVWAGSTTTPSPQKLQAIIDTTPAWQPVVSALACLRPGGRVVINAIGKEDQDKHILSSLNYSHHLWLEKEIKSVANVCRSDVVEFLGLAARLEIRPQTTLYPLEDANHALYDLKTKTVRGAKVLCIS
ncbi:MAG: alcohol dehydrogenase [Desulfobulbus sp.]|nr:MAG: alcohol dehydrogenase [Desulfobulbus sp.]